MQIENPHIPTTRSHTPRVLSLVLLALTAGNLPIGIILWHTLAPVPSFLARIHLFRIARPSTHRLLTRVTMAVWSHQAVRALFVGAGFVGLRIARLTTKTWRRQILLLADILAAVANLLAARAVFAGARVVGFRIAWLQAIFSRLLLTLVAIAVWRLQAVRALFMGAGILGVRIALLALGRCFLAEILVAIVLFHAVRTLLVRAGVVVLGVAVGARRRWNVRLALVGLRPVVVGHFGALASVRVARARILRLWIARTETLGISHGRDQGRRSRQEQGSNS